MAKGLQTQLLLPMPVEESWAPVPREVQDVLVDWSQGSTEDRGAVFTRREVVEFILDLVGYTPDSPLHQRRFLEPSFGNGDFLLPALDRLLLAAARHRGQRSERLRSLERAIVAVELHAPTFHATRKLLESRLLAANFSKTEAEKLLSSWLRCGDFLLEPIVAGYDYVVGNPPYVRQERIPDVLLAEYRQRYSTIYDRADIYIPFIERSLRLLAPGGRLGLICADRWMKNRYGGPLRRLVSQQFRLLMYIDMVDTVAFHTEVAAYPAITVFSREPNGPTRVAHRPAVEASVLKQLAIRLRESETESCAEVQNVDQIVDGDAPWILNASSRTELVRRLEATFPALEEAGCRVGIGVATGADKIFIGPYRELDVEDDRKLPLVTTRDLCDGHVNWRGLGVINPFTENGSLVALSDYPRLRAYFNRHSAEIRRRHVSKSNPQGWYRTIDRIVPSLATVPKLLIPDIKGAAHIVYEEGRLYPHHNLYYIVSDTWDLKALQAVLMSGVARLFVAAYSTKMRGGYLRFQAQYLRRIRLPTWEDVPVKLRQQLVDAAETGDREACNAAAFRVYRFSDKERHALLLEGD